MRIKLSQSDWESIGKEMGWLKAASGAGIHPSGPWSGISGSQGGMEEAGAPASKKEEEIMGKIIDHNARVKARLDGGGKPDPNDRYAAHRIISEAEAHGHEGLAVNSDGMIVETEVSGNSEKSTPITVDSKSWGGNWRKVKNYELPHRN
jgi:hypothetical protein